MVLICCTLQLYTYTWGTAILNKRKFLKKFICKGLTYAKSSFSKNNNEVTAVPPNFKKLTGLYYLFIHDIIYCRGQDEVLSWVDIWYYFTNHQNCWQKIEEEQKTQNRAYQMWLFIKYTMKWSGWWEHKFPPEYKLPGKIVRLFFLNNPRRTWVSGCRWGQISPRPPG